MYHLYLCFIQLKFIYNISDMNVFLFHPQPIHELVVQAVARGEIEELVVALKVLGNAGHPASLKPIMKLLPGFGSAAAGLPLRIHIDAVLALRNIAKREPKMVRLHFFNTHKTCFGMRRCIHNIHLCESDPGNGCSAVHGQGSPPRAPYGRCYCAV